MNHPYVSSQLTPGLCSKCNRDFIAHTKGAECEACGKISECNLIDRMLLCPECETKNVDSVKETADSLINRAQKVDSAIRYNGDVFNAETIANAEVREKLNQDESLSGEAKDYKMQSFLVTRLETLQKTIFNLDQQKFEAVSRLQSVKHDLREFGNKLRKEIREKIQASDNLYQPPVKSVKPKIKKEKKSPIENMIQQIMTARGVTRTEAEILLKDAMGVKVLPVNEE